MSTISPDCRDGDHPACIGDAWNHAADAIDLCVCTCHPLEEMPPEVGERIRTNVMAAVRRGTAVKLAGWDPGAARVARPDGDLTYREYLLVWAIALVAAVLAVMFG